VKKLAEAFEFEKSDQDRLHNNIPENIFVEAHHNLL
jgi:hypothetical protein